MIGLDEGLLGRKRRRRSGLFNLFLQNVRLGEREFKPGRRDLLLLRSCRIVLRRNRHLLWHLLRKLYWLNLGFGFASLNFFAGDVIWFLHLGQRDFFGSHSLAFAVAF